MSFWHKVKVGSLVTCFSTNTSAYHDNLIVVYLAHDHAVLRHRDGSKVVASLLEPSDYFELGEHEYNEHTGSLDLKESDVKEFT